MCQVKSVLAQMSEFPPLDALDAISGVDMQTTHSVQAGQTGTPGTSAPVQAWFHSLLKSLLFDEADEDTYGKYTLSKGTHF